MSWEDVLPLLLAAGSQIFSAIVNLPINLSYCKCRQIPEITVTSFQMFSLHEQSSAKADELTLEYLELLLPPESLTQHAKLLKSFVLFSKQFLG